ncbi:MAG: type II secretion system protein GspG [Phycisphaerae bacterium]|nr:type II secretion system protein GspG [Phycisphaerae bacterium]
MPVTPRTSTNRTVRSGGFTLIELLAVMLILTILVLLIGGVANRIFNHIYIDETKNSMKIIMSAIVEYRKVKPAYPTDQASLVSELTSVAECRALIGKLEEKVWSTTSTNEFRDSWGNPIVYSPSGGLAGAPGLTSAGPDGDISTEEDNVRHNK